MASNQGKALHNPPPAVTCLEAIETAWSTILGNLYIQDSVLRVKLYSKQLQKSVVRLCAYADSICSLKHAVFTP